MNLSLGILAGLAAMFSWGIADFLAALSSRKIGNLKTLFWMQIFGFIFFLTYFFLFEKKIFPWQTLPFYLLLGFLQALAFLSFYQGMIVGKVSLVSPIVASWALVTVILSIFLYQEVLGGFQPLGVVLISIGVILVSTNLKEILTKNWLTDPGIKLGFLSMLAFGISMALITPQVRQFGWFLPVMLMRFLTIFWLLFYSGIFKKHLTIGFNFSLVVLLFLIGVLDTSGLFSYSLGVQSELAAIVAPVSATFPLVTVSLARIFLKEKLVFNQVLGIVGVIAGLVFLSL